MSLLFVTWVVRCGIFFVFLGGVLATHTSGIVSYSWTSRGNFSTLMSLITYPCLLIFKIFQSPSHLDLPLNDVLYEKFSTHVRNEYVHLYLSGYNSYV